MNHWYIFLRDIPEKCILARTYFPSHGMNLKPIQSANSNHLLSLVRFPLFLSWCSSSTFLFSPPPAAIKGCNDSPTCVRRRVHTQEPSLTFAFYLRNVTAFFLPLHSLVYASLVRDLGNSSISFPGSFTRGKLTMHFSSLKPVRNRGIINIKREVQEYCSEKTGKLSSEFQNLEMKNDMYKDFTSIKEVNAAAAFSSCFSKCKGISLKCRLCHELS